MINFSFIRSLSGKNSYTKYSREKLIALYIIYFLSLKCKFITKSISLMLFFSNLSKILSLNLNTMSTK